MDYLETYIKMCEKSEEVQEQRSINLSVGFWAYNGERRFFWKSVDVYTYDSEGQTIWLPRQDQLQEMLDDRFSNRYPWILAEKFAKASNQNWATSMEQLWLAFVMKEKYNKVWDGENWVKND